MADSKINRKECEEQILELLKEIREVYRDYNPQGEYLSMCLNSGSIHFNNAWFSKESDCKKPIEGWLNEQGEFTSYDTREAYNG